MATEMRERVRTPIRALRAEDAAAVTRILCDAPEAVFWPESSVKEALGWKGALALVNEAGGKVMGFLIGRQAGDEAEILNLAVERNSRRKGEGGALLRTALEEFRVRGVSRVFLEVRESNEVGLAFYEKHGFSKVGRREGYYRDPEEAAIVMERKVTA
jgi:tRNA threonylcarbamoyladenosine biosynthesis protein TsaB